MFIEWTVTAAPLSRAEQHAVRVYEGRSSLPWWLSPHGGSLFLFVAFRALELLRGGGDSPAAMLAASALIVLWMLERTALCGLIDRYETDLRLLDAGGSRADASGVKGAGFAERHALRIYRLWQSSGRPWWIGAATLIVVLTMELSSGPADLTSALTYAVILAMVMYTWWEQTGLCMLLQRHDNELRRLGAPGVA